MVFAILALFMCTLTFPTCHAQLENDASKKEELIKNIRTCFDELVKKWEGLKKENVSSVLKDITTEELRTKTIRCLEQAASCNLEVGLNLSNLSIDDLEMLLRAFMAIKNISQAPSLKKWHIAGLSLLGLGVTLGILYLLLRNSGDDDDGDDGKYLYMPGQRANIIVLDRRDLSKILEASNQMELPEEEPKKKKKE